jgi:signal-transduction protein with cAMP-binding, CBS, and nucleotidyltransferase domain
MPRIREILQSRSLFSVESGQSVSAVVRRMAELNVGAILVVSNGRLSGVFSERDLMTRVVLEDLDPVRTPVDDVMTTDLITVEESAGHEEAMELMQGRGCRHLPVLRDGHVAGFLSMRDVMDCELALKTEELLQMRAYIQSAS